MNNTTDRQYDERLTVSFDSIENMRLMNNQVLIRVYFIPKDGVRTKSGIILAGMEWNENERVARFGTVAKMPNKLVFKEDLPQHDKGNALYHMEHKTEIDIEVGDVVYFGRIAGGSSPIVKCGDITYFLVNYAELIMRIRDEVITPLNGFAIVSPVQQDKIEIKGLILNFNKKQNRQLGVVKYLGNPNERYYGSIMKDAECEVGDAVIFKGEFFMELDDDLFKSLDEKLGYVQRCWIIGVL